MSQRYVKDSFWTDPYIEKCSPDYKLVFLYLLTNPLANISGVYEIRTKRIAYETGYDIEVVENILNKFSEDKKIIRIGDWIILVNHIKHQNLGNSTAEGVNREIKKAPEEIQALFIEKTLINSKNEEYIVLILKDSDTPPIGPPISGVRDRVRNKVKDKVKKEDKKTHGEFKNVFLSEEEYQKLIDKLDKNSVNNLIEELSGYIQSFGKDKYKDHYATLQNWARKRIKDHIEKKVEIKKNNPVAF